MRSRAWATWLIFTICALAVLEGLGWVTWKALALERAERSAHAQAEFQERIRLALWRMESEITPILAQEAARPYFHYQSFYPAERAYTRMLQEVSPGEVMVPSPLLDASGPYMRVHYQIGPDGAITSPQSPAGSLRTLAESQYIDREFLVLAGQRMSELTEVIRPAPEAPVREIAITPPAPQAAAPPQPPPMPVLQTEQGQSAQIGQTFDQPVQKQISEKEYQARQNLAQSANSYQQESRRSKGDFGRNVERQAGAVSPAAPLAPGAVGTRSGGAGPLPTGEPLAAAKSAPAKEAAADYREYAEKDKLAKDSVDLKLEAKSQTGAQAPSETAIEDKAARKAEFQDAQPPTSAQPSVLSGVAETSDKTGVRDEERLNLGFKIASVDVSEVELGPFKPLWRQNPRANTPELFFERAVNIGGIHLRQGLWMDWPVLKARLLGATSDLLTGADLVPLPETPAEAPTAEMLASFPVLLRPGAAPEPAPLPLASAPHLTLGVTWLAVVGGVIAIGAVLRTSMELSDRRGRFVSAVTHELRTPLTTFRLYTGILAGGMVKDDDARREYLATLEAESGKLAGIVENVLDYAKLGGRPARNDQPISAADLASQVWPSLERSARQRGMELVADGEVPRATRVCADPATVERILLNLVDNACKYAAESPDRRIHVAYAVRERPFRGDFLEIGVRDHGPGIPGRERRRIFRAFHRAKRDHRGPHSGLGLGLALSRGLARELGGDLELGRVSSGTQLRLALPVCP